MVNLYKNKMINAEKKVSIPFHGSILLFIFSASLNKKHNEEKQSHINISHR